MCFIVSESDVTVIAKNGVDVFLPLIDHPPTHHAFKRIIPLSSMQFKHHEMLLLSETLLSGHMLHVGVDMEWGRLRVGVFPIPPGLPTHMVEETVARGQQCLRRGLLGEGDRNINFWSPNPGPGPVVTGCLVFLQHPILIFKAINNNVVFGFLS
jgi:hypothetical protein